jgi:hypothetical protein
VLRPIRLRRISAAKIGVATTYMPVMKPETLAGVFASPAVCRICATPYRHPSTAACLRDSAVSRPRARGASRTKVTLAIAKRTARKSSVGTRVSRSWIRKNVLPQTAVTARSAAVASRVVRREAGTRRTLSRSPDSLVR